MPFPPLKPLDRTILQLVTIAVSIGAAYIVGRTVPVPSAAMVITVVIAFLAMVVNLLSGPSD